MENENGTLMPEPTGERPPLDDYPRPQFMRPEWLNLNGIWDYGITSSAERMPEKLRASGEAEALLKKYSLTEIAADIYVSDRMRSAEEAFEVLKTQMVLRDRAVIRFTAGQYVSKMLELLSGYVNENANMTLFAINETTGRKD